MRGRPRLGRFDWQVRAVLLLLVVFLVVVSAVDQVLLESARGRLAASERRRVSIAASHAFDDLGRMLAATRGRVGATPTPLSRAALERAAAEADARALHVLDPSGRLVASSSSVATGADRLRPALEVLQTGRDLVTRLDDPMLASGVGLLAARAMTGSSGRVGTVAVAVFETPDLGRLERRIATLRSVQIGGVVAIAFVALAFANWASRPYRRMAQAVDELGLDRDASAAVRSSRRDEPDDLVRAFGTMIDRLREQDVALRDAERGRGGLGDLVRFASRSASTWTTGVVVVDRRSRIAAINGAGASMISIAEAEAVGRSIASTPARLEGLSRCVRDAIEAGRASSREVLSATFTDGRRGHVGVSVTPAVDLDGRPSGALVLVTDLTEIRELQEHARAREQLAEVGKLSAGIAHEFRNALGTILAHARWIEKRGDAAATESARAIVEEVESVGDAVEQFLAYARPPEPQPARVELEDVVRASAAAADARVAIDVEGSFGSVVADPSFLRRVFDNLFRNAAEAGEGVGRTLRVTVRGRIAASSRAVQIEVEDDGPGIPGDLVDEVFTPFVTTRANGTGLGLAMVRRTLVDLGGHVEAVRGRGGGASFRLRLPLATESGATLDRHVS